LTNRYSAFREGRHIEEPALLRSRGHLPEVNVDIGRERRDTYGCIEEQLVMWKENSEQVEREVHVPLRREKAR